MVSRALIVLLLVLNLGIAAWWVTRPEAVPASASASAAPRGVPRLQLPGEVSASAASVSAIAARSAADAPMSPPQSADAMRCFTFGPFEGDAAARATAMLASRGLRSRVRGAPAASPRGWDVRLPPFADRAAAQAAADRLAAAGVADYRVIPGGDGANGIALGRYRSEAAAQRRQAALQAAGFAATIHALDTRSPARWIDVAGAPSFDPAAARASLGAAQVLPADCDTLR